MQKTWLYSCFLLTTLVSSMGGAQHSAPLPTTQQTADSPKAGYDSGFFVEQGVNSLALQGRVQTRFTHLEVDDGPNQDAFEVTRARLTLKGKLLMPGLSYKFQADFGKGSVALKDYYFDYCLPNQVLCIRPGQFKRPFSRQHITSSGKLELVDRSLTDKAFGAGRDIGVMLHDNYEKSPMFEYALGFFNGTGDKSRFTGSGAIDPDSGDVVVTSGSVSNVPEQWHPALVLRLGYNYGGIKGYSEADFEGGGLRFAVGGSLQAHFDAHDDDDSLIKAEVDTIIKLHGLSASGGVYHTSEQEGRGFGDRANGDGGVHAQLGYLIAKTVQPVVRYGMLDPRHLGSDDVQQELTLGLNYYLQEHRFKWQSDFTALTHRLDNTTDWQFRSQVQLCF